MYRDLSSSDDEERIHRFHLIERRVSESVVGRGSARVSERHVLAVHHRMGHTAVVAELVDHNTEEIRLRESTKNRPPVEKSDGLNGRTVRSPGIGAGEAQNSAYPEQCGKDGTVLVEHDGAQTVGIVGAEKQVLDERTKVRHVHIERHRTVVAIGSCGRSDILPFLDTGSRIGGGRCIVPGPQTAEVGIVRNIGAAVGPALYSLRIVGIQVEGTAREAAGGGQRHDNPYQCRDES